MVGFSSKIGNLLKYIIEVSAYANRGIRGILALVSNMMLSLDHDSSISLHVRRLGSMMAQILTHCPIVIGVPSQKIVKRTEVLWLHSDDSVVLSD